MPVTTSAAAGQLITPATARLADAAGLIDPAQPADAGRRLEAGAFVWLDMQNPGADQLRAFGQSLRLDERAVQALAAPSQRPSFTSDADSVQAVVPSANPGRAAGDILGIRVLYTGRFLVTTHPEPCPALESAYRLYQGLPDDKKAHGPFVLFFVLDQIVDSFEPELVRVSDPTRHRGGSGSMRSSMRPPSWLTSPSTPPCHSSSTGWPEARRRAQVPRAQA
jgi:Mg2+ and Co2+ transporter CorA